MGKSRIFGPDCMSLLLCILFISVSTPLFTNESLVIDIETAIQRGMANSFELGSRNLQLRITAGQLRYSIRGWLPQLQLSLTNSDSVTYGGQDNRSIQMNAKITQQLYDGGRLHIQRTLGYHQFELQQKEYLSLERGLRSTIWSQYHQLLIVYKQLKIQEEALIRSQQQLAILRLEETQGSITSLDLLNGEIAIRQLELDMAERRIEFESGIDSFKRLLHLPITTSITLVDTGIDSYNGGLLPWTDDQLRILALTSSLEYQGAEISLRQRREELTLSKRTFIPTVNLDISIGVTGERFPLSTPTFNVGLSFQFDNPTVPVNTNLNIGSSSPQTRTRSSSLSLSPFQQVGIQLSTRQAELSIQEALRAIDELEYAIPEQIILISKQYALRRTSLQIQRELLELENRRLHILELQLNQGTIKRIDFLDAQTQVTQKEIALLQAVLELLQIEWTIATSLGLDPDVLSDLLVIDPKLNGGIH